MWGGHEVSDNNEQRPPGDDRTRTTGGDSTHAGETPPEPVVVDPEPVVTEPVPRAPQPAPIASHRRSAALWWGSLLVFVGALLLVTQFVPEVQAWRYWPLIIVALGIRQLFGPARGPWKLHHLGEGLSTIAIGVVFLGQMTGNLPWNVWLNILRLWPLLLVSFGLEIIGKSLRSEFVRLLGSLVIVAGLVYGAYGTAPTAGFVLPFGVAGDSEEFSFEADSDTSVERGTARIEGVVGTLSVEGGKGVASAQGTTPFDPIFETDYEGDAIDVRVAMGEGVWGPTEPQSRLGVVLGEEIEWDLDIEAGVSSYEIDLRDIVVRGLDLEAGVSDGTLTLGQPVGIEPVEVNIDSGVSALTIRVPRDASTRIRVNAGLTGLDTQGRWTQRREGDSRVWESDDFGSRQGFWEIVVEAGVSGITIEYY